MIKFDNNRISILRELKGLSVPQLADKIGSSRQLVHNWEKGEHIPSIESLLRIANLFDANINFFFIETITTSGKE